MGIQKSRKTIQDAVADSSIFEGDAIDTMFKMMRRVTEMRSIPKVGGKVFFPPTQKKKLTMSLAGVTTLMEAKESQKKMKIPPGGSKKNNKNLMDNRNKKDPAQERREREKSAKAMDERMNQEEEEMTMMKDCAALFAQAKLQSEKEKKAKELDPSHLESLLEKNVKVKPTGVLKISMPDDQIKKDDRSNQTADRLLADKMYLTELANNITQRTPINSNDGVDNVYKVVKDTAEEALQFLTDREDFWEQLAIGTDKTLTKKGKKTKPSRALESTRLIF